MEVQPHSEPADLIKNIIWVPVMSTAGTKNAIVAVRKQFERDTKAVRPYKEFKAKSDQFLRKARQTGISKQRFQAVQESMTFADDVHQIDRQFSVLLEKLDKAHRSATSAASKVRRQMLENMTGGRRTITTW